MFGLQDDYILQSLWFYIFTKNTVKLFEKFACFTSRFVETLQPSFVTPVPELQLVHVRYSKATATGYKDKYAKRSDSFIRTVRSSSQIAFALKRKL